MRRAIVLLAGLALGAGGVTASSAVAGVGSYQVSACNAAPDGQNNSWRWATTDQAHPSHLTQHASCPYRIGGTGGTSDQEGGLSTTDTLGLSNGALPGTSAGWTFVAPGGTTISEITYERYIGHMVDPDNFWSPALRVDGVIVPGETCLDSVQNGETCSIGGPPGQGAGPAGFTGLGAHELTLGVVCEATVEQECVTGATQHKVWAAMYGATVTIADSTAPTLNAPSGALWEGGGESGAVHSGTQSVAVSAYDDGGGVQSITLTADGQPVQRFLASCSFTFAQPCLPSTGPRMLTLVTNGLSNGPHTLGLVATDAAGNQSAVASEQITVAKSSPTGSPSSAPTSPVGTPASVSPPGGVIQQAILHLRAALRGRELVAYVKGPISGRVRVSFSGRRHGRTVAFGTQVRSLRHGALTALFRLGPRTAARALIRVSATLGHEQAVGSTLQRKRR